MFFLSLVIPTYQSESFILRLLTSAVYSRGIKKQEIELIIVDDASTDETVSVIRRFFEKRSNQVFGAVKILALSDNGGPARARNVGVSHATGKVVVFLDADVVLYDTTVAELIRSFREDPDLFALTGVWDKRQHTRDFFPRFKALRDWSYWINERDPRNYYYLFSTRIAAINRELFLRLGGFDETYKAALVEDIDLTYRIARRYAVVFNRKVMVHHEFEHFTTVAKKYFLRSYYWSKMYRERKKFDPVATTAKEAVTTVSAGGLIVSCVLYLVSRIGEHYVPFLQDTSSYILAAVCSFLLIHLWGVRKFLWFCVREEGLWFAIRAFVVGLVLYLVILSGAVVSWIR